MSEEAGVQSESLVVAGTKVTYAKGGSGAPLVLLHHSIGRHGWHPLCERLAASYTVYAFDLPGFGESERPTWARDVRDLAIQVNQALDQLRLSDITLVGLGFGGWVAAEMATMNQLRLRKLVLVGAAGIQPREGAIADQLVIDYVDYVKLGFEDMEAFERHFGDEPPIAARLQLWGGREMAMRVTWKPWMFRRSLPHLLGTVTVPALVVWGEKDRIIPLDSGKQYAEALPNATLRVLEGAGHFVAFERPDAVAELIASTGAAVGGR